MSQLPLWKRCRILANPARLTMLDFVKDQERLYVQEVADGLGLQEDVASKNLQLLASGGFLESETVSKYRFYSLPSPDPLLEAVLRGSKGTEDTMGRMIKTLTALTHERRVSLISILKRNESLEKEDLFLLAQVSVLAGRRHIEKLVRRRWVAGDQKKYRLLKPRTKLSSVLLSEVK